MLSVLMTSLKWLKTIQLKYILIGLLWVGSLWMLNSYKNNRCESKMTAAVVQQQNTVIVQSDKANTVYDEKKTQSADKYTTSIKYITKYVDRISNEKVNGCDSNFILTGDDIRMYNDPSGAGDTKPTADTVSTSN